MLHEQSAAPCLFDILLNRASVEGDQICSPIAIPHAPHDPGMKQGKLKYAAVKIFRLDLILAAARGFLYYKRARKADVIHFDQVL